MKVKNYIFQGLSLLMLLCVFTTQVSALSVQENYVVNSGEETEDEQPVFRQITHETVVPNYGFTFGEITKFFTESSFAFYFPEKVSEPYSWFTSPASSYLAKLLEHHIAPNAP
jgi:hypothetical protein